jgi:uncharacterized protein (DUF952 family)
MIYKLLATAEWDEAKALGRYEGSAVDHQDGFIHLSGGEQVVETAARYFAGQTGLTMLTVDPARLGAGLRWEPSRDGALFPHHYGPLPLDAVVAAQPVPDDVAVPDAIAALLRI